MSTRREFLKRGVATTGSLALGAALGCARAGRMAATSDRSRSRRPNVVLILTDDQGYGDLGCHGNPAIRTLNLDRLHAESVRFTHCSASPVCSPTRASLLTGRYNYRTGVVDTYQGRSMMAPEEVTLAEMLGAAGYRTGIFGKWHLGDHYPMRAMDHGFPESLVHNGGGLAQPSDPEYYQRADTYFDPVLRHNGEQRKCAGYCTDIFTDAAIRFVEEHRATPFFVYLAMNAPHSPLLVRDSYVAPYRAMGLPDEIAKTYGMIANLDENVGRLLDKLKELGLERDTLVVFMTDNGAAGSRESQRYSAGLRAGKGTVYDGGIRVPCFLRWPARLEGGRDIDRIAAHINVTPTVLDACGAKPPEKVRFDGTSLLPLMTGTVSSRDWPDRILYFQWHRGDRPIPYKNCAVRSQKYKLVNGAELYDMEADPGEQQDVAATHPDVVAAMRAGYEKWFDDVGATRGYAPPRIVIGSPHENPVVLTRQDWRGAEGWNDEHVGYWEIRVAHAGTYTIVVEFAPAPAAASVEFRLGNAARSQPIAAGASTIELPDVALDAGDGRLDARMVQGDRRCGARCVSVKRS